MLLENDKAQARLGFDAFDLPLFRGKFTDPRNGDQWYWRAELATHAEGSRALGVPYDKRPGEGDILTEFWAIPA